MLDKIREYIKAEKLIKDGDRIVVGLSGGADSVCLLRVLAALRDEMGLTLYALHVNHGLRGEAADADEAFSVFLADSLGVECRCIKKPVRQIAKELGLTEEEAGRMVRYEEFERLRAEKKADSIAVAHHMNDQAETVLFRMCRGTGIRGMRGMLPKRDYIIRPLLCVSRDEIENYLKALSQKYCSDHTNEETEYNRNRIRKLVIPELCGVNESAVEHICDMASKIRNVYDWFEDECRALYDKLAEHDGLNGIRVRIDDLTELAEPVRQEIVRMMIRSLTSSLKDIENRHITGICALTGMETGKSIMLPYELTACREYGYIRLFKLNEKSNNSYEMHINNIDSVHEFEEVFLPGKGCLIKKISIVQKQFIYDGNMENVPKNHCTKWFDCDKIKSDVLFRRPCPDDYIMISKNARKKLARYMIDNKIPRQYRDNLLVLASGNEIIWIVGGRSNPDYYVEEGCERVMELAVNC